MVVHSCHPSNEGEHKEEDFSPGQPKHPISRIADTKRAGRVAQVVEQWPRECKVLSSTLVPPKKKQNVRGK
jgi:hypothetical protein